MVRVSSFGGPAQYAVFFARTMASSCDQETNRHGPLPTGAWSKPGGVGVGTTAATGIARNLGKMLSGALSVKTMVLSSGTAMPATARALPVAYSRAPLIGKSGHCRPALEAGSSARRIEARTSRAPIGRPSWNVAPVRRWKVYPAPVVSLSQRVARPGSSRPSVSNWTRLSNRRLTTSPLCTSLESAGSSDAGSAPS